MVERRGDRAERDRRRSQSLHVDRELQIVERDPQVDGGAVGSRGLGPDPRSDAEEPEDDLDLAPDRIAAGRSVRGVESMQLDWPRTLVCSASCSEALGSMCGLAVRSFFVR